MRIDKQLWDSFLFTDIFVHLYTHLEQEAPFINFVKMNQSDPLPFRILKRKRTQQFKLKRDRYTKDYHRSMRYGWANDYLLTSVIGLNDLVVPF